MTQESNAFGELGERVAAKYLERAGYKIIARRYRSGRRDIDLVAQQESTIAFVEVKARHGDDFGDPVEAVHRRKQRELTKSAQSWIDRHGRQGEEYRFDVVGVLVSQKKAYIRHIQAAFERVL